MLDLVGDSAARTELPRTLQQLGLHDVFHFSVLKHYVESENPVMEGNLVPPAPTAVSTNSYEAFKVEAIDGFHQIA